MQRQGSVSSTSATPATTARKNAQSRTRDNAPASTKRPHLAALPPPAPANVDVEAIALEYSETSSQILTLEAKKEALKARLLPALKASGRTSVSNAFGMVMRKEGSDDSEVFDKDKAIEIMTAKGLKIPTKTKKGSGETLVFMAAK